LREADRRGAEAIRAHEVATSLRVWVILLAPRPSASRLRCSGAVSGR
jgi:hypothetical protein